MPDSCLLVGLGNIAYGYDIGLPETYVQTHARAIAMHPGLSLAAAIDPSEKNRQLFEAEYGISTAASLDDLPRDFQAEIVIIAAPTQSHAKLVDAVLTRFRPRIVLCEKPLGNSLDEARFINGRCAQEGVRLLVNYIRPAETGTLTVKGMIDTGRMGPFCKGAAWYSKGLVHNGSHFVNLAQFWFGKVKQIQVFDSGRMYGDADPEPGFVLKFDHACIAFQAAWEESCSFYGIELVSPSGRLLYEKGGETISWQEPETDTVQAGYYRMGPAVPIHSNMERYQWQVAEQLVLAYTGKPHTLCTGEGAIATWETLENIITMSRSAA
jgi:predicted dehydrogenase